MSGFGRSSVFKSSTTIAVFVILVAANYGPRFVSIPLLSLVSLITLPAAMLYNLGPNRIISSIGGSVPLDGALLNEAGLVLTFYLFAVIVGFIHREHSSGF